MLLLIISFSFYLLFKEEWCESVEVKSPVGPYVAAFAYIICVLEAVFCESFVQLISLIEKEVRVSASTPVKLVSCLFDALELGRKLIRLMCAH